MNNRSNNWWIPLLIIGLIWLLTSVQIEGFAVLLILGGLLFMVRQIESNNRGTVRPPISTRYQGGLAEEAPRQSNSERVYKHALEAVSAAGQDPNMIPVFPVDLGVMAYKGDADPVVHRTWAVPDDADYIQPFVQLRLPIKATGKVRFELIDNNGETLFIHEDLYELNRGRNFVTPSARLPVHDALSMNGPWQLRIIADNIPIAVHSFEWTEGAAAQIRRHLSTDGEISQEMRVVLAENRLQTMSLDDLLSMQEEEEPQQQHGRA